MIWNIDGSTTAVTRCSEGCTEVTYTTGMAVLEVEDTDLPTVLIENAEHVTMVTPTPPDGVCSNDPEPPPPAR